MQTANDMDHPPLRAFDFPAIESERILDLQDFK